MNVFKHLDSWAKPETDQELLDFSNLMLGEVHGGHSRRMCTIWEVRLVERYHHAITAYLNAKKARDDWPSDLANDLNRRVSDDA